MGQRRFCSKDELNSDILFGQKNLHCSGVHGWISVLRLLLCTTFYGGSACYSEDSKKICFRQVLVTTRSAWRVENVENSQKKLPQRTILDPQNCKIALLTQNWRCAGPRVFLANHMTRREGTSYSNSLCTRGDFAPKMS